MAQHDVGACPQPVPAVQAGQAQAKREIPATFAKATAETTRSVAAAIGDGRTSPDAVMPLPMSVVCAAGPCP
ncbi:hypothetical protein [Methylorubrum populi]